MEKSKMQIRFKNNHAKEFNVLFEINSNNKQYIVYTAGEKTNDDTICYAGILKDNNIVDIKTNDEKEMIINIMDNFNRGI